MTIEKAVRLDDRNCGQRIVLDVAIEVIDVLEVPAQGGARHDLVEYRKGLHISPSR